jgi:branched-subunit amino acid aminotransferase/4-amino-4-deoxychorismate lyase
VFTPVARGEEAAIAGQGGAMPSPVLPGVTRAAVLEVAVGLGLPVRKQWLAISDLLDADEVFCTNASFGVLAMTRIEGRQIGGGQVGPVSAQLRQKLSELDGVA